MDKLFSGVETNCEVLHAFLLCPSLWHREHFIGFILIEFSLFRCENFNFYKYYSYKK